MIKLSIYFDLHMRIVERIINLILGWVHVFIQDRGTYKYRNARFVSLQIIFFRKNINDNHLSTLTFVNCCFLFTRNVLNIDTSWLLSYFMILWAFHLLKLLKSKWHENISKLITTLYCYQHKKNNCKHEG